MKIDASLTSLKMGIVLQDVTHYVNEIKTDVVNDAYKFTIMKKFKLLDKLLPLVAHEVTCAARNSAVISGSALEYVARRTQVATKRRRMEEGSVLPVIVTRQRRHYPNKPRGSEVQESLQHFLGEVTHGIPARKQPSRLVPEESTSMPEQEFPIDDQFIIDDISPSNGTLFTPTEVFRNLASIKKSLRGKMMDAWIEKKLVPVKSRKAITEMIRKAREPFSSPPEIWGATGRKALLSVEELRMAASGLWLEKGATWGLKEVTEKVTAAREAKAAKQGMKVTAVVNACCSRSNKNYMTQLVTMGGISLSTSAIQKTNRRFTSENSLMSAMSFACTVALSHFIVGSPSSGNQLPSKISRGASQFIEMIRKANNGLPVFPIKPQYVTSTDDTTRYIFVGKVDTAGEADWRISSSEDVVGKGTHSQWKATDSAKSMNGFRVKMTFTFSGTGQKSILATVEQGMRAKIARGTAGHSSHKPSIRGYGNEGLCEAAERTAGCIYTRTEIQRHHL
jgi:hypothetical protein